MMRFTGLPAPTAAELKEAYNRTGLNTLGYTFETAMQSAMFSKVIADIVYAGHLHHRKRNRGTQAPNQLALI